MMSISILFFYAFIFGVPALVLYFIIKLAVKNALKEHEISKFK